MNKKFIFWGGTGQAKVLNEALSNSNYTLLAIVDNREIPSPIDGVTMLHGLHSLDSWLQGKCASELYGLVAIGGDRGQDRLDIMHLLQDRCITIHTLVHTTAFVANDATLGEGSQILAQSAVCAHSFLGKSVIVNTSAVVDHDCYVGDGTHISPGAKIAGEVHIGCCAFIGTGAVVLPGRIIGERAIVGAGSVVTKDVPESVIVFGNPAKFYKKRYM